MSVAADSWLAFVDQLLILGDSSSVEKDRMKETMHHLIDIYCEALDAPKSGKKTHFNALPFVLSCMWISTFKAPAFMVMPRNLGYGPDNTSAALKS
ncbi:hypothetical protein CsSME_00022879 [Camellia sinensis var. sinensis]